jgi:hypothetical protein
MMQNPVQLLLVNGGTTVSLRSKKGILKDVLYEVIWDGHQVESK